MKGFKLVGRGAFTTAYLDESTNKVHLKSEDYVKECMAHDWFPDSYLFPKLGFSNLNWADYVMDYYPKTASLKSALELNQYKLYVVLRKLADKCRYCENDYYRLDKLHTHNPRFS